MSLLKSKFAKIRLRDNKGLFVNVTKKQTPEELKEYRSKYYYLNKERINKMALEWGRRNKDKRRISKDKWRAKNQELTNFYSRNYHYRKKLSTGRHTLNDIRLLYTRFPICPYCNSKKSNTIDHVIPLSRGGANDIFNLVAVCVSCNSKKKDKTLWEFYPILAMMWDRINRF